MDQNCTNSRDQPYNLVQKIESEWILPLDTYYSTISDSDLDSLVAQVKLVKITHAERFFLCPIYILLLIRIQRSRLRASLHRVDHIAIEQRQRDTIRQCVYSVEAPNSLWHIDGNHKLIRWKLVVHGGIDIMCTHTGHSIFIISHSPERK